MSSDMSTEIMRLKEARLALKGAARCVVYNESGIHTSSERGVAPMLLWLEEDPEFLRGASVADKIDFRIGDANIEAPKLGITFDMAFVDGDKRTYLETYEMVLGLLNPGGYILADNTLWDGHVTDSCYDHDHQTQGIRKFNDFIAKDPRVEVVILPLRDGLTLIRKK